MEAVQEILDQAWILGHEYESDDSLSRQKELMSKLADRIRRAALVESIRGLGLEWAEMRHGGESANTSDGRIEAYPDGTWRRYIDGQCVIRGCHGKAGALADYRRRVASQFEKDYPGITEEVGRE